MLSVLLLFIVSCTGTQPTVRPTIDATQRWLNAKCPPEEVCASQSDPEDVGRAFLEELIAGNCAEAVSFWKPDFRTQGMEICSMGIVLPGKSDNRCHLIEFKTDEVIIEQFAQGKSIQFSGYFLYDCGEEIGKYETNALKLSADDRDGDWLIIGFDE